MVFQESFDVETTRRGLFEVTERVQALTRQSGVTRGLCTIFVHHTSASLIINENADPSVQDDLDAFLARLVPDGDLLYTHTAEGRDDMPAHVRAALTATSLAVPVARGRCDLGTWQGVYLWEHRTRRHRRRLSVTIVGI